MTLHSHKPETVPVVIIGAGPVGLSLALGLARHGVRSVLLERERTTSERSKAPALHLRTREILRQWGVEHVLREAGTLLETMPVYTASGRRMLEFDFTRLAGEAERPGILFLEQGSTERLLLEALRATGHCDIRFGADVTSVEPGTDSTAVTYTDEGVSRVVHARYTVGCDGAGSMVRASLGLSFDGATLPVRATLADVRVTDDRDGLPWPRNHNGARGITGAQRLAPGHWRLIRVESQGTSPIRTAKGGRTRAGTGDGDVTEQEVGGWVREVLGPGPAPVIWASRFQFQRRSAPRYRMGRVLLAGDAAHVFPPVMGQGMNAGIQDAHNLAWKLAAALDGGDAEPLLASYDEERRHAVGAVSRYVERRARLGVQAPRAVRSAMLAVMRLALAVPAARNRSLRSLAMLDRGYGASPLLDPADRAAGVRLPDPELRGPEGERLRLHGALPAGAALLHLDDQEVSAGKTARLAETEGLPVLHVGPGGYRDPSGTLRALLGARQGWILVRPDRHVAWARTGSEGLAPAARQALGRPGGHSGRHTTA
ncbi:FAD-dependent monooxygenase [Nocardiopsis oceani]